MDTVNTVIENAGRSDKANPATNGASSSSIVQSVATQLFLTLQEEGLVSIQRDFIHVEAVSLTTADAMQGFGFASVPTKSPPGPEPPLEGSLSGTEVQTFTSGSRVPADALASVQLPASIVDQLG